MPYFRISARKPVILTEAFHGSPQPLQANTGIVPQLGHYRFLSNSIQIIVHQSPYHSTLYSLRYWQRRGPRKAWTVEGRLGRLLYVLWFWYVPRANWLGNMIEHYSCGRNRSPKLSSALCTKMTWQPGEPLSRKLLLSISLCHLYKRWISIGLYWKCFINLKYRKLQFFPMCDYYVVLWTWHLVCRPKGETLI
jgi:hypothetical protein